MANFDEVTEKAKEIFDGVSQKTGEFVSVQKMRITAGDIKAKISKLYKIAKALNVDICELFDFKK